MGLHRDYGRRSMARTILFFDTELGRLGVAEEEGLLTDVVLPGSSLDGPMNEDATPVLLLAREQLMQYLSGDRKRFDLPLMVNGPSFSMKVWRSLMEIPYGERRTYGQISRSIGHPRSSRAVGQACHRNPLPIIVPCHRVVGANGDLTGYAGGIAIKEKLLEIEHAFT